MRYLGFGLLLLGMAVATQAAEPGNALSPGHLDLLTVQPQQFDADGLARARPYRLTLSLVPVRPDDSTSFGPGFSYPSRLSPVVETQKEVAWATRSNSTFLDGARAAWLPLLRLETKGERLEIKPRRHSLSIQWNKAFY